MRCVFFMEKSKREIRTRTNYEFYSVIASPYIEFEGLQ